MIVSFITGGTLGHLVKSQGTHLPQGLVANFALQILKGLVYLHFNVRPRFIHADIKCENIFLSKYGEDARIKIGDLDDPVQLCTFGQLKSKKTFTSIKGTAPFTAPEFSRLRDQNSVAVGRKADIWSFGCVVLQMLQLGKFSLRHPTSGKTIHPFDSNLADAAVINFIANGGVPVVSHSWRISKQLFQACFVRDPDQRKSSHDVLDKFEEHLTNIMESDATHSRTFWKKVYSSLSRTGKVIE